MIVCFKKNVSSLSYSPSQDEVTMFEVIHSYPRVSEDFPVMPYWESPNLGLSIIESAKKLIILTTRER